MSYVSSRGSDDTLLHLLCRVYGCIRARSTAFRVFFAGLTCVSPFYRDFVRLSAEPQMAS